MSHRTRATPEEMEAAAKVVRSYPKTKEGREAAKKQLQKRWPDASIHKVERHLRNVMGPA
eukprot:CAMPEP_0119262376 /NCGR_PEP_ID=MMETSP1329-20130426/2124_1 /TAXON_ID=114041 /ORGANISM="Genus nov. species nov., Strain RCC1024" /LENGTH=59 /DNA_ID=CAMNT_0007262011 /DNA_START=170 /DNA_END=345 /DNA_ORIENTATION=-